MSTVIEIWINKCIYSVNRVSWSKNFLAFRITPTLLTTFFADIRNRWGPVQFIINDNAEKFGFTSIILFPPIKTPFMVRGTHFDVKSIKLVLSILRESLFALKKTMHIHCQLLYWFVIYHLDYIQSQRDSYHQQKGLAWNIHMFVVNHLYTIRTVKVQGWSLQELHIWLF